MTTRTRHRTHLDEAVAHPAPGLAAGTRSDHVFERRRRVWKRGVRRRGRDEAGVITVWTVLTASGVFLLLLGLVFDGGNAVDARLEAHRAAEQAARAAADEMRGVRTGAETVDLSRARARAEQILTQAGWSGTVRVHGTNATVTVTGRSPTTFLSVIGITSFPVDATGTATSITAPP